MSSPADRPAPGVASPLWRRLVASLIDALPLLFGAAVLTTVVVATDPEIPAIPPWNTLDVVVDYLHLRPGRALVIALSVFTLIVLVQGLQLGRLGATAGTRVLGLSALRTGEDDRPSQGRILVWLGLGLALTALGGLTWWWGFADPTRRTLHDRLCGIRVVHS